MEIQLSALLGSSDQVRDEMRALRCDIDSKIADAEAESQAVRNLCEKLLTFHQHIEHANRQQSILRALRFDTIDHRFEEVKKEHRETFDWIFHDSSSEADGAVSFVEWLRSGSDVFHIEGKAGSGKSTLLKFICKDDRTARWLGEWAGAKKLICGHFFFWKAGSAMQRSLKGLMQSLLYAVLDQAPDLLESLFPMRWKDNTSSYWRGTSEAKLSMTDMQDAFKSMVEDERTYENRRLCFFIDGLDEFDEFNGLDPEDSSTYSDLIRFLADWAHRKPDVKLCVSSRDWTLFRHAFKANQKIRLQDLTKNDMRVLATSTLQKFTMGGTDLEGYPAFNDLVDQIVDKAEGVFLWVVLVLKSLCQGLQHKDSPDTLLQRLEKMPQGLENFLGFTLESIDTTYIPQSARVFAVAMAAAKSPQESGLSLLRYSFLEDIKENPMFALNLEGPLAPDDLEARLGRARYQLDACCKGLLETRHEHVTFLHRSVQDFLDSGYDGQGSRLRRRIQEAVEETAGSEIYRLIAHSFLAEIRALKSNNTGLPPSEVVEASVGFAAYAVHRHAICTKRIDTELIESIDRVFVPPELGPPSSFFRSPTSPVFSEHLVYKVGDVDVLDFVGVLALQGCSNLKLAMDSESGSILGRSPTYLLKITLKEPEQVWGKSHLGSQDRAQLAAELLARGASLDVVSWWDSTWSYTAWESFLYRTYSRRLWAFLGKLTSPQLDAKEDWLKPKKQVPPGALEVLKTLLKNGANPFLWCDDTGEIWFHWHSGIIYPNDRSAISKGAPTAPSNSLRRMLELKSLPATRDILPLLPSHEAYEEKWNKCRKVGKKEARRQQGFTMGPERNWDDDLPPGSTHDPSDPQRGDDGSGPDSSAGEEQVKYWLQDSNGGGKDMAPPVARGEEGTGGSSMEILTITSCAEPSSTASTKVATHGELKEGAIPPAPIGQRQTNDSTQTTRNGQDQVAYDIQPALDANPVKATVLGLVSHPAFTFACGRL